MPLGRWGTGAECAEELGLERQRVHQLIAKGALGECRKVGFPGTAKPVWMIPYPFQRKELPVGRPRKDR